MRLLDNDLTVCEGGTRAITAICDRKEVGPCLRDWESGILVLRHVENGSSRHILHDHFAVTRAKIIFLDQFPELTLWNERHLQGLVIS